MAVAVQIIRARVVGNNQIRPAIVIEVSKDRSEAIAPLRVGHASFGAHICERTVTIVVKQVIAFSNQAKRPAENVDPAVLASPGWDATLSRQDRAFYIVVHVPGNEEV